MGKLSTSTATDALAPSAAEAYLHFQDSASSLVYLQGLVQETHVQEEQAPTSPPATQPQLQNHAQQLQNQVRDLLRPSQLSGSTVRTIAPAQMKSAALLNSLPPFPLDDNGAQILDDVDCFTRHEHASMFISMYSSTLEPCYKKPQKAETAQRCSEQFPDAAAQSINRIMELQQDDSFTLGCLLAELYLGEYYSVCLVYCTP